MSAVRKPAPPRGRELAMIHIAAGELGLIRKGDDSAYRDMLWSVGRVRSAKDLDQAGRDAVIKHLRACGWGGSVQQHQGRPRYRKGSQAALIRHYWTRLARYGAVHDGSDRALRKFVRAQSAAHDPNKHGWDDPSLLPGRVASAVIEHLKQWCAREAIGH